MNPDTHNSPQPDAAMPAPAPEEAAPTVRDSNADRSDAEFANAIAFSNETGDANQNNEHETDEHEDFAVAGDANDDSAPTVVVSESGERLQKLLAQAGVASRRAAEELIAQGRVSVNGHVVREPGTRADLSRDRVTFDGKPLSLPSSPPTVVVLHKPKGYVTTVSDPEGRPTVMDLVHRDLKRKHPRLHPVGRLDFDTSGLLLLTDDGDLTQKLTHPSGGVEKTYQARVSGPFPLDVVRRLESGVKLEDGVTAPCRVRVKAETERNVLLELTLREGRNRQVRRMLDAVGHPVKSLRRVKFGELDLRGLPVGESRELLPGEVSALRKRAEHPEKFKPSRPNAGKKPLANSRAQRDARSNQPREPERASSFREHNDEANRSRSRRNTPLGARAASTNAQPPRTDKASSRGKDAPRQGGNALRQNKGAASQGIAAPRRGNSDLSQGIRALSQGTNALPQGSGALRQGSGAAQQGSRETRDSLPARPTSRFHARETGASSGKPARRDTERQPARRSAAQQRDKGQQRNSTERETAKRDSAPQRQGTRSDATQRSNSGRASASRAPQQNRSGLSRAPQQASESGASGSAKKPRTQVERAGSSRGNAERSGRTDARNGKTSRADAPNPLAKRIDQAWKE